ncbi:MAG: hypothetical protein LWX56_07580 [Ignavibacteria bacterium]|nr:hypothetical protein [Ignavibacteria bacterium]
MRLLAILFLTTAVLYSQDCTNLTTAKNTVKAYYENGVYEKELNMVIDSALYKLSALSIQKGDAAVFDVDETTLSNYSHIASMDYGFRLDIWNDWIMSGKASAIMPVKRLYDSLLSRGVRVLFLTGRISEQYTATYKNLKNVGYSVIDTLVMKTPQDKGTPMPIFKENKRLELEKKGYRIIMCIGDQLTDMQGKATGIKVKLPNHLYLVD